jgi:hypothetical protein
MPNLIRCIKDEGSLWVAAGFSSLSEMLLLGLCLAADNAL